MLLFVLPWWAIVDCVRSSRSPDGRAFLVVFLVLTWSLGSLVYGLFVTGSRALRIFTVLAVVVPGGLLALGVLARDQPAPAAVRRGALALL